MNNKISWNDFLKDRQEKEDGKVSKFYEPFKDLGRGHLKKVPLMEKKNVFES